MKEHWTHFGQRSLRALLAALGSLGLFLLLVRSFDAPLVLAGLIAVAGLVWMFMWPDIATLVVVAVLYLNLAGLAVQRYNLPAVLAGSVALLLGIPLIHYLIIRRQKLRADVTLALMLVFLLVQIISSAVSKDFGMSAKSVATYVGEGIILYLLILNVVRNLASLRRVVWTVMLMASLLGCLAVFQAVTHNYNQQFGGLAQRNLKFESEDEMPTNGKKTPATTDVALEDRAFGPVGDPNLFAQVLLILLPLAAFRVLDERSRLLRAGAAAVAGIILVTILLTYSRGAFVSLAFLVLIATYFRYVRPRWLLAGALAIAAAIPILAPHFADRVKSILGAAGLVAQTASVQPDYVTRHRATEMSAGFHAFLDHPVLGVGPGLYVPYYSVNYQERAGIGLLAITIPRPAHCLYIQLASETGIFGLAVFLAIVLTVLYRLFKVRREWADRHPELSHWAVAFALGIIGYLGAGLFLHLAFERYFWFLLAMGGAVLQIAHSSEMAEVTALNGMEPVLGSGEPALPGTLKPIPRPPGRWAPIPDIELRFPAVRNSPQPSLPTRPASSAKAPAKPVVDAEGPKLKVAYIMSRFPKLTETFVLYEMTELERLGTEVEVYPLLRERQKVVHPEVDALLPRTHFHRFISFPILRAHGHFLRRKPAEYFRVWSEVLRGTWGSANFFFGAVGILPKSVRFAYEMAQSGVRHVHAHFATHPALSALIVHRLTGIPFSFTAHAADIQVDRRMLDRKIAAASFVVAISQWNKDLMVRECGENLGDKIHVIHCGVTPEDFEVRRGKGKGPLKLISVGSLEEYKGHTYLIEACRLLLERGVRFQCSIVGTGPLRGALAAQIKRARLKGVVELLGARPRPEVTRLLTEADVMVLASVPTRSGKQEGIPVALMEAMASALPVVSTRISGIPELIAPEESGLLVPPADARALADAIERLSMSATLRQSMGGAGRRKVISEFNLGKNAAALRELILDPNHHTSGAACPAPAVTETLRPA